MFRCEKLCIVVYKYVNPYNIALSLASSNTGWNPPHVSQRYKATFAATIDVPSTSSSGTPLSVLFNTAEAAPPTLEVRHRFTTGGNTTTSTVRVFHFKRTMNPLPTYLVAVAVGNFDFLSRTSRAVQYRIVTTPGYADWAHLALNASVHAAEFFGDRYGLPYV